MFASTRRSTAQSIIETVVGIIFLIPIVLFLFDVGILILANTANDNLAKQAARAAASAAPSPPPDPIDAAAITGQYKPLAQAAAQRVVDNYGHTAGSGGFITNVTMSKIGYNGGAEETLNSTGGPPANVDPGQGNVSIMTHMQVRVPVPFPGFPTTKEFFARAVEPIVALPPQ